MKYTLIAAMDKQHAIGLNQIIPWHLPDDFKHFKNTTVNHCIVMGRKTAESLRYALPNRLNIVFSRKETDLPDKTMIKVESISDMELLLSQKGIDHVFVIGGGEIYSLFLPLATEMIITHVHVTIEHANVFFPKWTTSEWIPYFKKNHVKDNNHPYSFEIIWYNKIIPNIANRS